MMQVWGDWASIFESALISCLVRFSRPLICKAVKGEVEARLRVILLFFAFLSLSVSWSWSCGRNEEFSCWLMVESIQEENFHHVSFFFLFFHSPPSHSVAENFNSFSHYLTLTFFTKSDFLCFFLRFSAFHFSLNHNFLMMMIRLA